jgi:peptidoglycan/LPS O-acetylase OafA/YrhL
MAVMVLLVAPLVTSLPLADYVASGSVWNYFFSLITTAKAMFFLPGVFADHRDAAVNGSIWSVLIEVRLYLILAVLYILGILKSAGRYNAVFFGMVFLFWMNPDWLPRFAQGARNAHVCFLFFVGVFLYMNREYVPLGGYWMLPGLLLCGMTLGTPGFPFAYMLLLTAIFVATCFGSGLAGFGRFGDLSYGVYLYGWPVQQLVVEAWPGVSALVNTCVSIGISLLIAYFSWRFVEEPALRLKAGLLQLPLHFFRARRPQTSYGEVLESSKSD